jgi:hypothetical protein
MSINEVEIRKWSSRSCFNDYFQIVSASVGKWNECVYSTRGSMWTYFVLASYSRLAPTTQNLNADDVLGQVLKIADKENN